MRPTLQPNSRHIRDFKTLTDLSDRLTEAKELAESQATPLSPAHLFEAVEKETPSWDDDERFALIRQVMSLISIRMETEVTASEIVEVLEEGLESADFFDPTKREIWENDLQPLLDSLVDSRLFRVTSKSANLAYEHPYLLQSARVITDVRPVFDNDVVEIDGAVVSHVLRLNYDGRGEEKSVSIVLDTVDLQRIRNEADRALKKGKLIKQRLGEGSPIDCHITGEGLESTE